MSKPTKTAVSDLIAGIPHLQLIGGQWSPASTGATFTVHNPATGGRLAEVADATSTDAQAAVTAATGALAEWSSMPGWKRYEILRSAVDALRRRIEQLAMIICAETGKPIAEAVGEAHNSVRFFEWFSHETLRLPSEAWPSVAPGRNAVTVTEPVGVVAAITPWNFPAFMVACKVGAALAAGCTVILKPAEQTPLTALMIADTFHEAGLPSGVLNVATTSRPGPVSEVFLKDPRVACISFTGSRRVGESLMRGASTSIKRVLLELGGNAPVVVLEDADLNLTAQQLTRARYLNGGQACVAANRVYAVETVVKDLVDKLTTAAQQLQVGDPHQEGTDLGPLIDATAVERIESQISRAISQGGTLVTGGSVTGENDVSSFVEPTIIVADAATQPEVFSEEIFGPVLAVVACRDEDQAVTLANATNYGLAGYVFTRDQTRGLNVATRLEVGSVAVNCALVSEPQLAFGGVKTSGLGRERGRVGVDEFRETKTIQIAT